MINIKKIFLTIIVLVFFTTESTAIIKDSLFATVGNKAVTRSDILEEMVTDVNKIDDHFHIKTSTGKEFKTKYVVLATGNNYRHLGAKGEEEMLGK